MGKALKVNRGGGDKIAERTFAGNVTCSLDYALSRDYGYQINLTYSNFSGLTLKSGDILVKANGTVFGHASASEVALCIPSYHSENTSGIYAVLR